MEMISLNVTFNSVVALLYITLKQARIPARTSRAQDQGPEILGGPKSKEIEKRRRKIKEGEKSRKQKYRLIWAPLQMKGPFRACFDLKQSSFSP